MWSDLLQCAQLQTSSLTLSSGHGPKHMVSSKLLRWQLSDPVSPTTRDASSLVQPRDLLLCLLELLGWAIACVPAHCRDQSCLCSGIFLSPIGQASCRLQSARSLQVDSQAGEDLLTQSTQLLFGRAARNKELLTREVSYRTYSQGSCRITFFF